MISGRPVSSINAYEINHEIPLAEAKALAKEYGVENAADLLLKMALAYRNQTISEVQKKSCPSNLLRYCNICMTRDGPTEVAWDPCIIWVIISEIIIRPACSCSR